MSLVFKTFSLMRHSDENSEEHLDLVSTPIIPPSISLLRGVDWTARVTESVTLLEVLGSCKFG